MITKIYLVNLINPVISSKKNRAARWPPGYFSSIVGLVLSALSYFPCFTFTVCVVVAELPASLKSPVGPSPPPRIIMIESSIPVIIVSPHALCPSHQRPLL